MYTRIFQFLLLAVLVRTEPNVIDSLTIQLPSQSEDEQPPEPPPKPLLTRWITAESISTSTATSTAQTSPLPPVLSKSSSPLVDLAGSSAKNPPCPGITCFIMTLPNSSAVFDCTHASPQNAMVTHELDCNYWQPPTTSIVPITAKFFNNGPKSIQSTTNHAVPLRIVLKPRTGNPNLRITADAMVPGALTRLVEAVQSNVKPRPSTPIKLSLIMVKIRRMTYEDLANLFMVANMSGLTLWNPDFLEETSFLRDAARFSSFSETYVRLTFYCETENDFPAFGRLWLPWLRWQVKFLQCRGHYNCYRWPREERLCCNPERCLETPGYVITHADKLAKRDPVASLVHQQQVLDFYSCETESDLTNPLVELRRKADCWAIPGYGMLSTTLRPISHATTTAPPSSRSQSTNMASTNSTANPSTTLLPILQQISAEEEPINHKRMRNLVIGIICLLLLNLITFCCFVVACCWAWRKLNPRQTAGEVAGSYAVSGSYEKQGICFEASSFLTDLPSYCSFFNSFISSCKHFKLPEYQQYDDDYWWTRFIPYGNVTSNSVSFKSAGSINLIFLF